MNDKGFKEKNIGNNWSSFKKMSGLSKKLLICYETILKGGILDNKDDQSYHEPLHQLITNLEEIKSILNEKKTNYINFCIFLGILYMIFYITMMKYFIRQIINYILFIFYCFRII